MKESVCCCGHYKSSHFLVGRPEHIGCMNCKCGMFTDQRISHRRAASKQTREAGPKAEIAKLLDERNLRWFRMQSGDIVIQVGARRRRIMGNKPGTPDFLILYSRIVWIEAKKDGEQSDDQKKFQAEAEARGEIYLLVRSAEEVEKWLRDNT